MKCHIIKLELIDKWRYWRYWYMICDVINDVTEVGQKLQIWRIDFCISTFYSRMLI